MYFDLASRRSRFEMKSSSETNKSKQRDSDLDLKTKTAILKKKSQWKIPTPYRQSMIFNLGKYVKSNLS